MVMPLGRDSDGTWIAVDIAERDAIGLREAARVNDRCRIPGNDAIYRALTVPGLDASTWTAGDWTMDSLTLSGNLTVDGTSKLTGLVTFDGNTILDSGSPTATHGDETGSPVVEYKKADAGSVSANYSTPSGTGNAWWSAIYDSSENLLLQRLNNTGSFIENTVVVDPNGGIAFARNLAQSADSAVKTLGSGGGSPVDVIQKTAAGTGERKWRVGTSDAANDKREVHNSSEELVGQSHNGASWDTGYFLDNNADFNVTGQLLVAGALAADAPAGTNSIIVGDGASGVNYGIAINTKADAEGKLTFVTSTNDCEIAFDSVNLLMSIAGAIRYEWDSTAFRPRQAGIDLGLSALPFDNVYATGAYFLGAASSNTKIIEGAGSPEGVETAAIGSIFMRNDGGAGTSMYVKETGAASTGWVAK